jgi:hypothetical protein
VKRSVAERNIVDAFLPFDQFQFSCSTPTAIWLLQGSNIGRLT